jgi:hypothetical protein
MRQRLEPSKCRGKRWSLQNEEAKAGAFAYSVLSPGSLAQGKCLRRLADGHFDRNKMHAISGTTTRWNVGWKRVKSAGVQTASSSNLVPGYLQPGHDGVGDYD